MNSKGLADLGGNLGEWTSSFLCTYPDKTRLDSGLLAAIQEEMVAEKVNVTTVSHPDSIYAGAIGAALWGAFRYGKLQELETAAA